MSQRSRSSVLFIVLVVSLILFAGGCKKRAPTTEPAPTPPPAPAKPTPPPAEPKVEVTRDFPTQEPETQPIAAPSLTELERQLRKVYFDFDRYDLDDEDRAILRANAEILKANSKYRVVIEGHCDERGTIEYNLALGERRANSVRDYLSSLGVSPSRMRIISFGEERPANPGHNEAAWSQNRRAEFKLEG